MVSLTVYTTHPLDTAYLKRVGEKTLQYCKRGDRSLNLIFVGEGKMRTLNKFYRGKNRITDVLAFSYDESEANLHKHRFIESPILEKILGEIVICVPYAAKQAKREKHSLDEELAALIIHGVLHLAGYDHEQGKDEEKKMFDIQSEIFKTIA